MKGRNPIGDEAIQYLANYKNLTVLHLWETRITAKGVRSLRECNLRKLEKLDIRI